MRSMAARDRTASTRPASAMRRSRRLIPLESPRDERLATRRSRIAPIPRRRSRVGQWIDAGPCRGSGIAASESAIAGRGGTASPSRSGLKRLPTIGIRRLGFA